MHTGASDVGSPDHVSVAVGPVGDSFGLEPLGPELAAGVY